MNVDQLGNLHLHCGQKDPLHGLSHPRIFHGWLAYDGRSVDGVLAVRDAGEVEDWVIVGHRIEAGVVAKWALTAQLAQLDVAFKNDFGIRRHFKIDRFALHNLNRLAAQETSDQELLNLRWCGHDSRKRCGWVSADGHGYFKPRALQFSHGHLWQPADGAIWNCDRASG